jgi:hypothetical protein
MLKHPLYAGSYVYGRRQEDPRRKQPERPHEWWPTEQVRTLGIPRGSLSHLIRQGLVRARQLDEPLHRWVVWADEAEQKRLRQYHRRAIGDDFRHHWADTPLCRTTLMRISYEPVKKG